MGEVIPSWNGDGVFTGREPHTMDQPLEYPKFTPEFREAAANVVLAVNNESDEVHWATRSAALVMALGIDVVFTEAELVHAQRCSPERCHCAA